MDLFSSYIPREESSPNHLGAVFELFTLWGRRQIFCKILLSSFETKRILSVLPAQIFTQLPKVWQEREATVKEEKIEKKTTKRVILNCKHLSSSPLWIFKLMMTKLWAASDWYFCCSPIIHSPVSYILQQVGLLQEIFSQFLYLCQAQSAPPSPSSSAIMLSSTTIAVDSSRIDHNEPGAEELLSLSLWTKSTQLQYLIYILPSDQGSLRRFFSASLSVQQNCCEYMGFCILSLITSSEIVLCVCVQMGLWALSPRL